MNTIWVDSLVVSQIPREVFDRIIAAGNTLVVSNTAVDIKAFQDNIGWLEEQLTAKKIRIELWISDLDEMTYKRMYWGSCCQETPPSTSFEDAVISLPNAAGILDVSDLVLEFGIPFGSWLMESLDSLPFTIPEDASILGVDIPSATRSEMYRACKKCNRMDIFKNYNKEYVHRLAIQHCCDAILNSDGSITYL